MVATPTNVSHAATLLAALQEAIQLLLALILMVVRFTDAAQNHRPANTTKL